MVGRDQQRTKGEVFLCVCVCVQCSVVQETRKCKRKQERLKKKQAQAGDSTKAAQTGVTVAQINLSVTVGVKGRRAEKATQSVIRTM